MKFFPAQFAHFFTNRSSMRNLQVLVRLVLLLGLLITFYSIVFHYIMAWEGRQYSWITGFYWTLTVMSTLGFGDITFHTDLGLVFSIFVLLSGVIFMLIVLPFTFIQFFYAPWIEAQNKARAPRQLPETTHNHVIMTIYGPVTSALIKKLSQYQYSYVVLVPELEEALRLADLDIKVVVGELDDPDTYRKIRVEKAAMVVTSRNDIVNTNVVSTVRGVSVQTPIIATAEEPMSVDILELAGCSHVLRLDELMGQFLARRCTGGDAMSHVIGQFEDVLIAEANMAGTPLVGKRLHECNIRQHIGVTVLGAWERGTFEIAGPQMLLTEKTVIVMAGSRQQLEKYDELFCIYHQTQGSVVVIGGGRVGRATARTLAEQEIGYRIVEREPELIRDDGTYILGDAAELESLEKAGIMTAPTVIITTHDDDTNIYLTIYCRRLRPDIQIICRASQERNVATLHRSGADFVMSYASMGANIIFNLLDRGDILMLAEGLAVFKLKLPTVMVGKTLAETAPRQKTGCNVVAVITEETTLFNPDPAMPLPAESDIILIGTAKAESRFLDLYGDR